MKVSWSDETKIELFVLGLLDYDKNHNHDYFGQYCNHDYLTRLFAGPYNQKMF